ncbi:hypothetical protein [Klebsiella pneumoniae]|uniref:hypothetical protein n=1 Tax=Klebsiella pneumoniae TaxID=573 RepID=UPI003B422FCC|nr:hypothetical protein [Klebsiella quasipneumoniae]
MTMAQESYNFWSLIVYSISAIIALWMLMGVKGQIKEAIESNKINKLNSLLALESQIAARRQELSSAGIAIGEFANLPQDEKYDAAALRFNEAIQMYLNALDRLCFCIKQNYLDEAEMKAEYRELITLAVRDHEDKFGASTPYRNIKKIYDKWVES